jgi:ribosomal subunit interface protein
MTLQVTGKNVEAGDAYKAYITDKLGDSLEKYIGPEISGHIRLEKERGRFRTDCSIRLKTGLLLESHGEGADAYASADAAVERMDKRLRRYKRRLKGHHVRASNGRDIAANDFTVRADEDDTEHHEALSEHPVIIAEAERGIKELPVSEAVMQLDLTDRAFLVFRNASHGGLNVVYRRADGHIGWIDANMDKAV